MDRQKEDFIAEKPASTDRSNNSMLHKIEIARRLIIGLRILFKTLSFESDITIS